jgi:hypothetical protein
MLLEQQKRLQASGKRKILKLEEYADDVGGEVAAEDIKDVSVNHLEFSLKHDASSLLSRTDTANLTKRDLNLIKLVCCSGLYPHLAIPDSANPYRSVTEQVGSTW